MKQFPKSLRFKKNHKLSSSILKLKEQTEFFPRYGMFGVKILENSRLTFKQMEACRRSLRRKVRYFGRVWVRIFTNFSITGKSIGMRMGSGKGNHSHWISLAKAGRITCEFYGKLRKPQYMKYLEGVTKKLPVKARGVKLKY